MSTVHEARLGRFCEDFAVGDVYQHPIGRTISEADCTWFTQLTCNTNQNHFNAHLAATNPVSMLTRGLNQDGTIVLSWKRTVMIPWAGRGIGENYFPQPKDGPLSLADEPAGESRS